MKKFVQFRKDDSGATAIEYGLLASLIAVAIIATVTLVGGSLDATFSTVNTGLGGAGG